MKLPFEEIDNQPSPIGDIALRRRRFAALGQRDIYEVKLGDEFLMSSAFVEGEVALADLALKEHGGDALSVVVGGLGLGYTADAALRHAAVRELLVVEYLPAVIRWHEESRVPLASVLCADERYRAVSGDFFSLAEHQARKASTQTVPATASTLYWWILITRRAPCWRQAVPVSTIGRVLQRYADTSGPAAFSHSGATIRRTPIL